MAVFSVPSNLLSSMEAMWKSAGMLCPIDGVQEEQPAEEEDLGEQEQPHADAGADAVIAVFHAIPFCLFSR